MKKILSLFIIATVIATCFAAMLTAKAAKPSQEIADEHGYTIFTTPDNELYYVDADGFVPNVILVNVKNQIDLTPYQNGTATDFYGVEIIEITEIISDYPDVSPDDIVGVEIPAYHQYRIITASFYTYDQAKLLFKDQPEINSSHLFRIFTPDYNDFKLGDVNQNGVVEARDYLLLKRAYFGTFTLSEQGALNGDINQNGKIDARDYLLLKRIHFGTYTPAQSTPDEATSDIG